MIARVVRAVAALAAAMAIAILPSTVAAHPLGNYTVNRAIVLEIGSEVELLYVVDMAEIPAFEAIQVIDVDADGVVTDRESATYAGDSCSAHGSALEVAIDERTANLRDAATPRLEFPPGVGGLPTLRLECRFVVSAPLGLEREHTLTLEDGADDTRIGWREVTARSVGAARIVASDVPAESPSALLTAYPEDRLDAPADVSSATLRFRLGDESAVASSGAPGSAVVQAPRPDDPLAMLIGGVLSPAVVAAAFALSLGLGALHALSPGHGKTLVAAYVIGARGSPRSALLIGVSVAASHTAGVFVLGIVTLLATEFIVPERLIAWLSLASGIVVTGLGTLLLARAIAALRSAPGGHDHSHDHPHPHQHADRPHGHSSAPGAGRLSWRSALALGFAGGAVPSASAVIVLLVAISTDRLLLGVLMIGAFGTGMALVLGGLALVVTHIGQAAGRPGGWLGTPIARRAGALVPGLAGIAVLVTGLAFSFAAFTQLA